MFYKVGGGDHLQQYNADNGQYSNEDKTKFNEGDKENLVLVHYYGFSIEKFPFHFPMCGIHDNEYCDIFVKYSRQHIKKVVIDERKAFYLLGHREKDDKSLFLEKIGYGLDNTGELLNDIIHNTEIQSLTFSRMEAKCLKCEARTTLKGKIVTTIWELKANFEIRFITMIPGGDKRWNSI